MPSAMPSYRKESYANVGVNGYNKKFHHRKVGMCEGLCSGHGRCGASNTCNCFTSPGGTQPAWMGYDCSLRSCPRDTAWVGDVMNNNEAHPEAECSNKGICDRSTGLCDCFYGYDGIACQRHECPDNCNHRGSCFPERMLAEKNGRAYNQPWDASKALGCVCDIGYRGPACELQECPTEYDPLDGFGNEAGRDCSGRGICDYTNGTCSCFFGFVGLKCQVQNLNVL